tara:strand:- start:367 stop:684 length:318 start_codon:yes stop_codon:yes gene_type:complete
MNQIKITEKQLHNVLNEVMGFTTDYPGEAEDELKQFVEVVGGPIANMLKSKSLSSDDVIAQRIYQLTTEGGELHILTQELIDLLEGLSDKQQHSGNIGFQVKGRK